MNERVCVLRKCKEELETHVTTLEQSIANPLLQTYREENERYKSLALDGLARIENELAQYKKIQ